MDKKQVLYSALGVVAFIIGGVITREKALEGAAILEQKFSKTPPPADSE